MLKKTRGLILQISPCLDAQLGEDLEGWAWEEGSEEEPGIGQFPGCAVNKNRSG